MNTSVRWLVLAIGFVATAAQGGTTASLSCDAIDGSESIVEAGTIALVGEMHGTVESPAFVSDLACSALEHGLSVTVALEIPQEEEERIAAYLASDGGTEARAALLVDPFWHSELQYGVSSEAMLVLLETVRRHQHDELPVKVVLLDRLERTEAIARDAFMASRLTAAATDSPRDFVVALTGNIHSSTRKGAPWNDEYKPMGLVLEERIPDRRVVALDMAYTGGTAWNCRTSDVASCHPYELEATRADGSGRRIVLDDSLKEKGYDGYYAVGSLTASPPAVESLPDHAGSSEDAVEDADEAAR